MRQSDRRHGAGRDNGQISGPRDASAGPVILPQGLWVGLFIHEDKDDQTNWVTTHARGGEAEIALTVLATVIALVKLRSRRDLVTGSIALVVLLLAESYIGGLIGDHAQLTAIHLPLAMALMVSRCGRRSARPGADRPPEYRPRADAG